MRPALRSGLSRTRSHSQPCLARSFIKFFNDKLNNKRQVQHHIMASKARAIRFRELASIARRRAYHSYDHPPPPGPFNATETAILSASLSHIPSHGFSRTTLSLGAKDAGYIDASTNLFPSGAFSLVHHHLVTQRRSLAQHKHILHQSSTDEQPLGVGAKVMALTWERLMANQPIIHRWQEVRSLSIDTLDVG